MQNLIGFAPDAVNDMHRLIFEKDKNTLSLINVMEWTS